MLARRASPPGPRARGARHQRCGAPERCGDAPDGGAPAAPPTRPRSARPRARSRSSRTPRGPSGAAATSCWNHQHRPPSATVERKGPASLTPRSNPPSIIALHQHAMAHHLWRPRRHRASSWRPARARCPLAGTVSGGRCHARPAVHHRPSVRWRARVDPRSAGRQPTALAQRRRSRARVSGDPRVAGVTRPIPAAVPVARCSETVLGRRRMVAGVAPGIMGRCAGSAPRPIDHPRSPRPPAAARRVRPAAGAGGAASTRSRSPRRRVPPGPGNPQQKAAWRSLHAAFDPRRSRSGGAVR
jgi:hypothetical protein